MPYRRANAWIACLALLLHMLSMPLSGVIASDSKRMFGWGGHCQTAQQAAGGMHAQMHATQPEDGSEHGRHHAGMQYCCCGAGAAFLAALPPEPAPLHDPMGRAITVVPRELQNALSPRRYWPTTNPRASPLA